MGVSLWSTTPTAVDDALAANGGINLGTKFQPKVAGEITHLRYYEFPDAAGTTTLRLYDASGSVVASITHTAVNGLSGWREVALTTPYTTTIDAWYVTTYHLSGSRPNFVYGTIPLLLNAMRQSAGGEIQTKVDGSAGSVAGNTNNGVYTYGALALPTSTFGSSNYGADVVFEPSGGDLGVPASTITLWGSGTPVTTASAGTWATATNATGANNATNAVWTSTGNGANATIRVEGHNAQTVIGTQPISVTSVVVTVYGFVSNASRVLTIAVQLTSGGTLIGTPQTMTASTTTTNSQTFTFTGVTWAQLANLGVRISFTRAAVTQSATANVDAVGIVVNYNTPTPASSPLLVGVPI